MASRSCVIPSLSSPLISYPSSTVITVLQSHRPLSLAHGKPWGLALAATLPGCFLDCSAPAPPYLHGSLSNSHSPASIGSLFKCISLEKLSVNFLHEKHIPTLVILNLFSLYFCSPKILYLFVSTLQNLEKKPGT